MRKEISIAIITAILSLLLSSLFFMTMMDGLDKSHRNFEYLQCEQFWGLAEIYIKTNYTKFDCELILEHGVVEYNFGTNKANWDAEDREDIFNTRKYAYQDEVNDAKRGKSE